MGDLLEKFGSQGLVGNMQFREERKECFVNQREWSGVGEKELNFIYLKIKVLSIFRGIVVYIILF